MLRAVDNYKIKVLLVDDKRENIVSLEQIIEDAQFPLVFLKAFSGQDALKIALYEIPAIILLDVQMPEMDGYEVARLLKGNTKTRNIPIIFVTASNQDTISILEGYGTGAVDYLFKPLNPAITKAKVQSFLRMHLYQKEVESLNHLVNNSLDLMCIIEAQNLTIQTLNPAWESVLGLRLDELKGKKFTDLVFGIDDEDFSSIAKILSDNSKLTNFETCIKIGPSTRRFFLWSFILKDGFWYCNGREFTERKIAEDQLQEAQGSLVRLNNELEERVKKRTSELRNKNEELKRINTDLDNFIYTASHDLKAPINNIEGLVSALNSNCSKDEETITLINMINQSVERFKLVIHELTDLAKAQSEEMFDEEVVEFRSITEEVKTSIEPLIKQYDATIIENFEEAPNVKFSIKNLRSILYNLISNAIKYSSPQRKPVVKLKTTVLDGFVQLFVEDNGLGIKDEDKEKAFSMFKRLHSHVEGTGIGLSLVKKMVENSGGKIELKSMIDKGSTFIVYLNNSINHVQGIQK